MIIKLFVIVSFFAGFALADDINQAGNTKITGRVLDSGTGKPIEYSNIILMNQNDSLLVMGTVTGSDGVFVLSKVPAGQFFLEIRFLGYQEIHLPLSVDQETPLISLGDFFLNPASLNLENVLVQAERSPITFMTDKKVIDVSQMQTSLSGTAAEVLENIPSVSVDIEGNVSLRGSQSFTVLIDGKISPMDAQDILQQIPASSIDKIEIITNPSSKYKAQGTAGIINIILKDAKEQGLSGVLNANTGLNDKYGGNMLFDYKAGDFSSAISLDYNHRFSPGESRQINRYTNALSTDEFNSSGSLESGRISYGIRGSLQWKFTDFDELSFGFYTGSRDGENSSLSLVNSRIFNTSLDSSSIYNENGYRSRGGNVARLNFTYTRIFDKNGHQLVTDFSYHTHNSDELTSSSLLREGQIFDGKRTTEAGPSNEFEAKVDYTLPYGDENGLEAGYQFSNETSEENTGLFSFSRTNNDFVRQTLFDRLTIFTESDQAVYSQIRHYFGSLGLQVGIRGEYTYRLINERLRNLSTTVDEWDLFPTFFSSYKFSEGHQMMASFTRRIEQPDGWQLEPFETFTDANNVRKGNPSLLNEYINSYEAGFQSFFGEVSLSGEVFYHQTINKIEGINTLYAENITLQTPYNVGSDYSTGTELMTTFDPVKDWNINLMGTIYNYEIKGVVNNAPFSRKNFSWNMRTSNVFKWTEIFQTQFNVNYRGPSISSQGTSSEFISADFAAKYVLFEKKLSLTLQIRDIFGTAKRELTRQSVNIYRYEYNVRESPMIMLNIRYNINKSDNKDKGKNDQDSNDDGEDF